MEPTREAPSHLRSLARLAVLLTLLLAAPVVYSVTNFRFGGHAMPQERQWRGALESDLKQLASQQEVYFTAHAEYSSDLAALGFSPTAEVRIELAVTESAWAAWGEHLQLDDVACGIYVSDRTLAADFPILLERPRELICAEPAGSSP